MALPPVEEFVRACREAATDDLVGFVAGLYEAQGWTVERTRGERFVVTGTGETRQIAVVRSDASPAGDPDIVVSTSPEPVGTEGAERTLDLSDLHEQLCYAVDTDARTRLSTEYLDLAPQSSGVADGTDASRTRSGPTGKSTRPDQQREPDGEAVTDSAPAHRESSREGTTAIAEARDRLTALGDSLGRPRLTAVLVIAVLAVAAGLTVGHLGGDATGAGSGGPDSGVTQATVTPTPTPGEYLTEERLAVYAAESRSQQWDSQVTNPSPDQAGRSLPADAATLPPGISANGTLDGYALADAHRLAVANTSYTLTLTYREQVDGRTTGFYREVIRVAADGRYDVSIDSLGRYAPSAPELVGREEYSGQQHRRGEATHTVSPREASVGKRTEEFLERFLSVTESRVADRHGDDTVATYRLYTHGSPLATIENATGTVFVTRRGVVRHGRWTYEVSGHPAVEAVVTLETTNRGETALTTPD